MWAEKKSRTRLTRGREKPQTSARRAVDVIQCPPQKLAIFHRCRRGFALEVKPSASQIPCLSVSPDRSRHGGFENNEVSNLALGTATRGTTVLQANNISHVWIVCASKTHDESGGSIEAGLGRLSEERFSAPSNARSTQQTEPDGWIHLRWDPFAASLTKPALRSRASRAPSLTGTSYWYHCRYQHAGRIDAFDKDFR